MNWKCNKCKTHNPPHATRCVFCSTPRPSDEEQQKFQETNAMEPDLKLKQQIHNHIEKMNPGSIRKLWRWMEDNLI